MVRMDWHYFRFPFLREGETLGKRRAIRRYLRANGYRIAQVTIDFEDWSWNEPYAYCLDKGDARSISWLKTTYLRNAVDQLERAKTGRRSQEQHHFTQSKAHQRGFRMHQFLGSA